MSKKRISLGKVAEKAGVSKSAASRVLSKNGYASPEVRRRVREAARVLGYSQNDIFSRAMSAARKGFSSNFNCETVAFVNAKPIREIHPRYSAISEYISSARVRAQRLGFSVCDIWLYEKNFTPEKLLNLMSARGIRGGIVFGHYYKNSIPKEFLETMKKFKFVSMGVKSNAPVLKSVFMDRFLIVEGFVSRIARAGYRRVGFVIERFADKCEDGKFTGGFLKAQLRHNTKIIRPYFWEGSTEKNLKLLKRYVEKNSLDALFSYSTDISEILISNFNSNAKLFHYDKRFRDEQIGYIRNQKAVGAATMDSLRDILSLNGNFRAVQNVETTILPIWSVREL